MAFDALSTFSTCVRLYSVVMFVSASDWGLWRYP